jgi:hypothetical protein
MRPRDRERGVMLMHAIVLMGLVSLVVVLVTGTLTARAVAVRHETRSLQALYAAEAGIATTVAALRAGETPGPVIRGRLDECTWRVDVRPGSSSGAVELDATGACGPYTRRRTLKTGDGYKSGDSGTP